MRRSRPLVRPVALALAVLIGALASGVPSHHHGDGGPAPVLTDGDHHGHGVQLVDQVKRLKSELTPMTALPAARVFALDDDLISVSDFVASSSPFALGSRAPPTARPRAPPVSA